MPRGSLAGLSVAVPTPPAPSSLFSLTRAWLPRVAALMWLQAGIYSDAPRPSWSRWALFHLPFQVRVRVRVGLG